MRQACGERRAANQLKFTLKGRFKEANKRRKLGDAGSSDSKREHMNLGGVAGRELGWH